MKNTRKTELIGYLQELGGQFDHAADIVPELFSERAKTFREELGTVIEETEQTDLFVPLVGGFSTGKSSALNSLIGRDLLPEKVSPETAIPTELHFDTNEHIKVLTTDGDWLEHDISALSELSEEADKYQVVKIYLNSAVLKEIQPLVLVDMPGFDSGLDQHNSAILQYITTGAMYLFMVNTKAGTVSRQDARRIEEIIDLGRSVKVFLTMTDLASPDDLRETHQYISEHMAEVTGDSGVGKINKNDVSELLKVINSADASALFDGMALPKIQDLYFDAMGQVNTAIKALSLDTESIQQTVQDAELSLKKVEAERERLLADARSGGVSDKCDLVIRRLENALHGAVDELVMQAKVSESALSKAVSDRVRATLSVEIQALVRKSTKDITYQFFGEINLNGMSLCSEGCDWLGNLISVVETETMNALSEASTKSHSKKSNSSTSNKDVVGSLGSLAIMIPHPVLRVALSILPGIIGQLFGNLRNNHEMKQYRQSISSQVIPAVISQVRPQVMESLNSVQNEIIRVVSEQIENKVSNQKAIYEKVNTRSESEIEKLRGHQETLNNIRLTITKTAQGVIA